MLQETKKEFIKIMEQKPLQKLHEELLSQIEPSKKSNKLLKNIEVPFLGSNVFGENFVKNSNWFFS